MAPTSLQIDSHPSRLSSRPAWRMSAVLLAMSIACAPAIANSNFEEDFDDPYKPWQEVAVQIPAPPKDQDLLPFEVSETASHRFTIDANSLTVGADGVVRYTLVTISN